MILFYYIFNDYTPFLIGLKRRKICRRPIPKTSLRIILTLRSQLCACSIEKSVALAMLPVTRRSRVFLEDNRIGGRHGACFITAYRIRSQKELAER